MSETILPIRLEFTYVYEDFFPPVPWRELFTWRKIAGWLIVLGLGVLAFVVFRRPSDIEAEERGWSGSFLAEGVLFLGLCVAIMLFYKRQRMSRKQWESTYPSQQPWVMTFSNSSILIELPTQRIELQWTTYNRFEETERWFILHTIDNQPLHLPLRAIPAERADDLRKLIAAQLSRSGGFPVQLNQGTREEP